MTTSQENWERRQQATALQLDTVLAHGHSPPPVRLPSPGYERMSRDPSDWAIRNPAKSDPPETMHALMQIAWQDQRFSADQP